MFRRARFLFALLAVFCLLLSGTPVYAGEGGEPTPNPVITPDGAMPGTGNSGMNGSGTTDLTAVQPAGATTAGVVQLTYARFERTNLGNIFAAYCINGAGSGHTLDWGRLNSDGSYVWREQRTKPALNGCLQGIFFFQQVKGGEHLYVIITGSTGGTTTTVRFDLYPGANNLMNQCSVQGDGLSPLIRDPRYRWDTAAGISCAFVDPAVVGQTPTPTPVTPTPTPVTPTPTPVTPTPVTPTPVTPTPVTPTPVTPTPPPGRTLDVRYVDQVYVQQRTEGGYWNHCGPASTAMLLHYEGKEKRDVLYDRQATLDLVCPLKINCRGATYIGRNLLAIQQRGLAVRQDNSLSFDDIRQSIDSGHPVVMGIKQANHVVIAVGYGPNNTVIINDPFGGKAWWTNWSLSNSRGATFTQPQLKGKNISYTFGSELTSSYGFIVSGPAPAPIQTRASIASAQGGTLVGQGATFTFGAGTARVVANAGTLDLTHTPLFAPSHTVDDAVLALSSFTLEANNAGLPISTATQPFAMQIALDPEIIDILDEEIGETSGEPTSVLRSLFSGRTNDAEKQKLSQRIIIAAWDSTTGQWVPQDTTVDLVNYQVSAQSNQFTEFAVFVKPEYTTYLPLLQQ